MQPRPQPRDALHAIEVAEKLTAEIQRRAFFRPDAGGAGIFGIALALVAHTQLQVLHQHRADLGDGDFAGGRGSRGNRGSRSCPSLVADYWVLAGALLAPAVLGRANFPVTIFSTKVSCC